MALAVFQFILHERAIHNQRPEGGRNNAAQGTALGRGI